MILTSGKERVLERERWREKEKERKKEKVTLAV